MYAGKQKSLLPVLFTSSTLYLLFLFCHKNTSIYSGDFLRGMLFFMTSPNHDHFFNTLRQRQDGQPFPDDIFKCIFLNENVWISIKISLKFVPKGPIGNIPALVQIMAWRRPGDKPLSEPMMVNLLTHICITRPQWVNQCCASMRNTDLKYYRIIRYL